ncbi:atp-binding cassette sub-family b [Holotrichia oblita]|nr:atp-binding cassette sub-family b [Holotrichia oblita]
MVKRLLGYISPYKKPIIITLIFMPVMGFAALLPPFLNSLLIDKVLTEKTRVNNYILMAIVVLSVWFTVALSEVLYNFIKSKVLAKTSYSMVRDLRRDLFKHLQKLSFDYYDNRPAGKILIRVTSYIDELSNIIANVLMGLIVDFLKVILIVIWLFIIDYRFALINNSMAIPIAVLILLIRSKIAKRYHFFRNKNSNRTAYIAENIQGIPVTKAFNRSAYNTRVYEDLCFEVKKSWCKIIRLNEFLWPVMDFFPSLAVCIIYITAFYIGPSSLTVGQAVSFIGYMGMFSMPLYNIAQNIQNLTIATTNLERIFETLDTPPSVFDSDDAVDIDGIKGDVKFENVNFCYDKGVNILENINLEVPQGKMIALVGPTGGGKTTLVSLLTRFYNLSSGTVYIDGQDISKVKLHSLRSYIGVMMQDSFIFSGSVMDNLRYGNPAATDLECIEAAKKAKCDEFISAMPEGYYTQLAEKGAGLSSGQIQLLSFARTIIRDPRILILDEATSSVDTTTESDIQEVLNDLLKGRTSFVVAHRLSSVKRADCILYVADRQIQEAGTHSELMKKKGLYYKLASGNNSIK